MLPAEIKLGIGTWAWGDRLLWDYGRSYTSSDLQEAFFRFLKDGIFFFSTSPTFGEGESERLLGQFSAETTAPVTLATKYVPRLWHLRRGDFKESLKASMLRLGVSRLKLFEMGVPRGSMTAARLAECAAEALDMGLIESVGLSGYSALQLDTFYEALSRFGYAVSCLETPYNLLDRSIENNGVLDLCRSLNITVIAQQPLAMGLLTGKYDAAAPAAGSRRRMMLRYPTERLDAILRALNRVGLENNGANTVQTTLNWISRRGIIPLPGVKTLAQASEIGQALNWVMTEEQFNLLDTVSG